LYILSKAIPDLPFALLETRIGMMQRASCFAAMLRTLPDDKGDFVEDGF